MTDAAAPDTAPDTAPDRLPMPPDEQRFERLVTRWVMACACVAPALAVLSGSF